MTPRIVGCLLLGLVALAPPTTRPFTEPATGMTFVEIPAGRFTMGSPASARGRNGDEVPHQVTIAAPFLLGRHEVTQREWRIVTGTSPSGHVRCDQCPVERVNYFDVQAFLDRLNAMATAPGVRFRLPTEAEWEYACRAGTTTPFSTGHNLTTDQANYNGRFPYPGFLPGVYRGHTVPVASFSPNPWGLYDMHGNVWEWTADWYGPYQVESDGPPTAGPQDPPYTNPDDTSPDDPASANRKRVIRGGSWYFDANSARCALRYTHAPQDRGFSLGVRVAANREGGTREGSTGSKGSTGSRVLVPLVPPVLGSSWFWVPGSGFQVLVPGSGFQVLVPGSRLQVLCPPGSRFSGGSVRDSVCRAG